MRDELALLGAQLTYKKRLEAMLKELRAQEAPLSRKVAELEAVMIRERKDVDRLEGRSLSAFVYYALGKKEEKLDAERRQFYAARVKYDAAARELDAIRQDIEATEEDLQDLQDCEAKYAEALEQKRLAIEQAGLPESGEIITRNRTLNRLRCQERELEEALAAGNAALHAGKHPLPYAVVFRKACKGLEDQRMKGQNDVASQLLGTSNGTGGAIQSAKHPRDLCIPVGDHHPTVVIPWFGQGGGDFFIQVYCQFFYGHASVHSFFQTSFLDTKGAHPRVGTPRFGTEFVIFREASRSSLRCPER